MSTSLVSDFIVAIRRGDVDDYLEQIGKELNARYKVRRVEAVRDLKIGTRVRVLPGGKRSKWDGLTGTVKHRNQQTVSVDLDNGEGLRAPATLLEVITGE